MLTASVEVISMSSKNGLVLMVVCNPRSRQLKVSVSILWKDVKLANNVHFTVDVQFCFVPLQKAHRTFYFIVK